MAGSTIAHNIVTMDVDIVRIRADFTVSDQGGSAMPAQMRRIASAVAVMACYFDVPGFDSDGMDASRAVLDVGKRRMANDSIAMRHHMPAKQADNARMKLDCMRSNGVEQDHDFFFLYHMDTAAAMLLTPSLA